MPPETDPRTVARADALRRNALPEQREDGDRRLVAALRLHDLTRDTLVRHVTDDLGIGRCTGQYVIEDGETRHAVDWRFGTRDVTSRWHRADELRLTWEVLA